MTTLELKTVAKELNEVLAPDPALRTVGVKASDLEANIRKLVADINASDTPITAEDALPGRKDAEGNELPHFSAEAVKTLKEMGLWDFEVPVAKPAGRGGKAAPGKVAKEPKAKKASTKEKYGDLPPATAGSVRAILNKAISDGEVSRSALASVLMESPKAKGKTEGWASAHVKAHTKWLTKDFGCEFTD